jgi:hypothetical protein
MSLFAGVSLTKPLIISSIPDIRIIPSPANFDQAAKLYLLRALLASATKVVFPAF